MHPAHHYRIHLWDDNKPARALESGALCGQTSPGIAHMWHMPGHTFSKLNRPDYAAWQQEASTRVDHAYMMKSLVLPDQIHNYAHNEEWLIRTWNDLGRARDGIHLAKALIENPRHPELQHAGQGAQQRQLWTHPVDRNPAQVGTVERTARRLAAAHCSKKPCKPVMKSRACAPSGLRSIHQEKRLN